jgi:hypothetical protein
MNYNLGKRGDRILKDNILDGEEITDCIKGTQGEAVVLTNKRLLILKWGFMTGNTWSGRCTAFDFKNITSIELTNSIMTGQIQVNTPAHQNANKSYWSTDSKDNSLGTNNIVTFGIDKRDEAKKFVKTARDAASEASTESSHSNESDYDELEKLMELKKKGIINETEFNKKKSKILGI